MSEFSKFVTDHPIFVFGIFLMVCGTGSMIWSTFNRWLFNDPKEEPVEIKIGDEDD